MVLLTIMHNLVIYNTQVNQLNATKQVVGSVHYLIANLYITYAYESLVTPGDVSDDLFAADFDNESWQSTLSGFPGAKQG